MFDKFKIRLKFEKPFTIDDSVGGSHESYQLALETWGQVEPIDAARLFYSGQLTSSRDYVIHIRYRKDYDINENWRIKYKEKILTIKSITDIYEDNKYYKIIASEYVSNK